MFNKYLVEESKFVEDLNRRLNDEEIRLVDFECVENIITVEFDLTSDEEEYAEYIRSRVLYILVRVINKYFNIYVDNLEDLYYFEKINKNIIKIELF